MFKSIMGALVGGAIDTPSRDNVEIHSTPGNIKYCPILGGKIKPIPVDEWRKDHPHTTWLYNPWTGQQRDVGDVVSDPGGRNETV